MMSHDYSPWISPVTGKGTGEILPDLPLDYIWTGAPDGTPGDPESYAYRPFPSPILEDIRLELLDISRDIAPVKQLAHGHMWLGNPADMPEETKLSYAVLPTPGSHFEIIPIPNPMFSGSISDPFMSNPLYPQIFASQYTGTKNVLDPSYTIEVLKGSNWKTSTSNSFALAQFKIEQALARTKTGKMIVQKRSMNYNWPNRAGMNAIPDAMKAAYGLEENFSFEGAQALNELKGLPGIAKVETDGSLGLAIGRTDYVTPFQLAEDIAEAVEGLELQIGALELEIAGLEFLIDLLGLGLLLVGGLSLAGLLTALLNKQNEIDENIQNILENFDQNVQNSVLTSPDFEQSVLSIFENSLNSWAGDQISSNIQNMLNNLEINSQQLNLYEDNIFIGDSTGKATQVSLSALGFLEARKLIETDGDVLFLDSGERLISRIKNDPVFYGRTIGIPYGTTGQRPLMPSVGMIRFNTDLQ